MDTHSNIHDLHDHREETEVSSRDHLPGAARTKASASKAAAAADFGSGWYHDAAIGEAHRQSVEARCHPVHW